MHMNGRFISTLQIIDRCRNEAPWLAIAIGEQGTKESPGLGKNNARILEYISSFSYLRQADYLVKDPKTHKLVPSGFKMGQVDETAWCACFVAWCLRRVGQPTIGMNAGAQGWLNFGLGLEKPQLGAITVAYKKHASAATTSSGYHVAFYLDGPAHAPTLFGGNQGNMVCAKDFHGWTVKGYRWPSTFRPAQPPNVA
jgi:uncharacterized protein (TIGR02594 family)